MLFRSGEGHEHVEPSSFEQTAPRSAEPALLCPVPAGAQAAEPASGFFADPSRRVSFAVFDLALTPSAQTQSRRTVTAGRVHARKSESAWWCHCQWHGVLIRVRASGPGVGPGPVNHDSLAPAALFYEGPMPCELF